MNRPPPVAFAHVSTCAVPQVWVGDRFPRFRDGRLTASGPFTLVMERRPDGWKILHDLTSSD
jgi:hypothetical protein